MQISAPAKINLFLRVGPKQPDGYHPISSWICRIGLRDELTFKPSPDKHLTLKCDREDLDCGADNLILRAAKLLQEQAIRQSIDASPVAIHLTKRIPVGAGLGGGSSDAAHTLSALNDLWNLRLSPNDLLQLAGRLGSDVPFFLGGNSTLCTGRGEILSPVDPPSARGCVLVFPPYPLATAAVYRRFDQLALFEHPQCVMPEFIHNRKSLPAQELMQFLFNDLEPAAFSIRPELVELRDAVERSIHRPVRMSGSGSTLFTLTDTLDEARRLADQIAQDHAVQSLGVELCHSTS